ncbi:MAG: UDP-N-acetylglucosamine--N-acetylmuramyl-(pentapeptide) pyrophosphoryl-undecaprenol N-acetylglucosamine transferase [Ilumatobacteraceae bacterium]
MFSRRRSSGDEQRIDAVVTGGGTSGHVIPALAILEALTESGMPTSRLRYVGARRGVETRLVPAGSDVECVFLPISGLQRSLNVRALRQNMALPFRLLVSTSLAVRAVRMWRPRVVVSVGGYASEPVARAARLLGVPLVCVSYDRTPGLATRRQARRAAACAVAFPGSSLPNAVVTGAPVRGRLRRLDRRAERDDSRLRFGVSGSSWVVAVVGGSLGSGALNDAVPVIAEALVGRDATIVHVTGPRFFDSGSPVLPPGVDYVRLPYCDDMASLYAACDVMVCRAGASTIAEIATVGVAAVIMPWSGAADDHQRRNAEWLTEAGAAVLVDDGDATRCAREVAALVGDRAAIEALSSASHRLGEVHRGDALVHLVRDVAG